MHCATYMKAVLQKSNIFFQMFVFLTCSMCHILWLLITRPPYNQLFTDEDRVVWIATSLFSVFV